MANLNRPGVAYANSLIRAGSVNTSAGWSFSAADGNVLLGDNGDDWTNFGKNHLGINPDESSDTKARYSYPIAKGGTLYRSALTAIRSRAAQNNDDDVFDAAGRMMETIDAEKARSTPDANGLHRLAPVMSIKTDNAAQGVFTGYAAVFGNVDAYRERVMPGAFVQSLVDHRRAGTSVKMFWYHDPSQPIGKWTDLAEDKKGLYASGQFNLKVGRAVEVYELVKSGDIEGLSIGYREMEGEDDGDTGVHNITRAELLEISVVSLPANPRAVIEEVKTVKSAARFDALCKALVAGKPLPASEFEDILRDAGVPKSLATRIASVGYARAIRSDSESGSDEALRAVLSAARSFVAT